MASRFNLFWSLLWAKMRGLGKWLLGALVALAILAIALVGIYKDKHKTTTTTNTTNKVEVAQVYEPSISTPLPPDTNGSGTTTTPATNTNPATSSTNSTGQVDGATTTPTTSDYIAPKSGIDLSDPIKYENLQFGLKAILPAFTQVVEKNNSVSFYSQAGILLYNVSIVKSQDSLDQIANQLKSSPEVSNLSKTNFAGNTALQFTTPNSVGYVISKNNQIYYILGNSKYLTNIAI